MANELPTLMLAVQQMSQNIMAMQTSSTKRIALWKRCARRCSSRGTRTSNPARRCSEFSTDSSKCVGTLDWLTLMSSLGTPATLHSSRELLIEPHWEVSAGTVAIALNDAIDRDAKQGDADIAPRRN